jgi:6-phosphogluconolactonase
MIALSPSWGYLMLGCLVLSACGGGDPSSAAGSSSQSQTSSSPGGSSSQGIEGTGLRRIKGVVTAVGGNSLTVSGIVFDASHAVVFVNGVSATLAGVHVGAIATVSGEVNDATNTGVASAIDAELISVLYPSCAPAGEQFINGVNNQLTVIGPYPTPPPGFVAGSVVRWNGGDRPTTSNGSVNGLTAQISASDIAAAGTAVVAVFNPGPGGGLSNSLTFTITTGAVDPQSIAVDPTGKFAYVMNVGCNGGAGGYVSMYTINPTTGALASVGPPVFSYGYGGGSVTVDPFGKFVYVTNSGDKWGYGEDSDGIVAMYSIDAATGALTSAGTITGSCPGLCLPASVAVDPSGKFAYVVNENAASTGDVSMYTINATTGALASIGTIAAGTDPVSIAVDPSGKFAYVVNENFVSAGNVSMYRINATTGALASIGTIAAGTSPVSVAVDPSGKFAYVVNENAASTGNVSMYTINATTGALASIGTIAAGTSPVSVAVDPVGKFVYVANSGSNDVSMYAINSTTGSLTLIGMIAAGLSPSRIAIHPSGKFAYVTNSGSNDVSTYSIGATGSLTLIGTIGT